MWPADTAEQIVFLHVVYRFHYRFLQIACVCHWQRHSGFKDKTGAVADDFMYYKESVGFNKNSK